MDCKIDGKLMVNFNLNIIFSLCINFVGFFLIPGSVMSVEQLQKYNWYMNGLYFRKG